MVDHIALGDILHIEVLGGIENSGRMEEEKKEDRPQAEPIYIVLPFRLGLCGIRYLSTVWPQLSVAFLRTKILEHSIAEGPLKVIKPG
jgi:hypothetical protein